MARKRLNTKLLIGLACGATILAVGLFVAAKLYADSPERAVSRAEAAMQEGNWDQAAEQYGKAYQLTQNADYQLKGIEAIRHQTTGEDAREAVQLISGALNSLVASNPDDLRAVRELMRFHADDPSFASSRASEATRQVRRLSNMILSKEPEDAEAKILSAVATLNLARFTGEQIRAEEAEAARETLRATVVSNPLDGSGVEALQNEVFSGLNAPGTTPEQQREQINDFVTLLDEVAAAAESAKPRDALPTDTALLHARLGVAYDAVGRVMMQLALREQPQDADVATRRQAANAAAEPMQEKALEQLDKAVAALDVDRDVTSDAFLVVHTARASALRQNGDPEAAEAELRQLVEHRPWDVRAAIALSRLLRETNRSAEAAEVMRNTFAASREPLPDIPGRAGYRAVLYRTLSGLHLADALIDAREQSANAGERRKLLDEAREAFAAYETARQAAGGLGETSESQRVEGELQLAGGDVAEGINTLTAALRAVEEGGGSSADRVRLLRRLAEANRLLKQTGSELNYLEQVVRLAPTGNDLYRLARLYHEVGRDDDARRTAEALLRVAPDLPQVQALLVSLAPEAERDEAYDRLPESTELERRVKLSIALRSNRVDEARRLAEALVAERPDSASAAVQLAQILSAQGETEQAAVLLQKFPDDRAASRALAQLQGGSQAVLDQLEPTERLLVEAQMAEAQGDAATMVAKLEEARRAEPDDTRIAQALFKAYIRSGRVDEAQALVPSLREAGADGMGGEGLEVQVLLARGEIEAALRAAERLAAEYGQIAQAQVLHGDALRAADRPAEAAESYRRAIELSPGDINALTGLVTALSSIDRHEEAQEYVARGLALAPNSGFFRNARANYELRFGNADQVLAQLRRAIEERPDSVEPRLRLAQALQVAAEGAARRDDRAAAQRYHADAVAVAEAGLEAFPQDARFLSILSASAPAAGGEAQARTETLFADVMRPTSEKSLTDNRQAVAAAADFYVRTNRPAEAETVIRRHLSVMGDASREEKAGVLLGLSRLLAGQNKTLEAVSVLDGYEDVPAVRRQRVELLASAASADPSLLERLRNELAQADDLPAGTLNAAALAEYRAGNLQEAQALLERADVEANDNANGLFLLGIVEARKGDGDLARAANLLQRSVELQPANTDALRALAQVRQAQGQTGAAESALRDLLERSPGDVAARLAIVQTKLGQQPPDYRAASREFRAADAAGVGDDPRLLLARANMEAARNDVNAAIEYGRRAAEQANAIVRQARPDANAAAVLNETANYQNAYLSLLLRFDRAQEALNAARATASQRGDAAQVPYWVRRAEAEALARLGRQDEATTAYAQAFQAAPPQARDEVLLDVNRHIGFDAAYGLIRDEVEGEQPNPTYLLWAATLYAESDQLDKAISGIQRVREVMQAGAGLTPEQEMELNQRLGTLYLRVDPPQLDEAIAAYRRVLEQRPDAAPALNNLAYALTLKASQPETPAAEVEAMLKEAVEVGTRAFATIGRTADGEANPNVLDSLAWAQASLAMHTGDSQLLEEATARLREAAETAERGGEPFAEVYYHLARAREAAGEVAEARQHAERGLEVIREREQAGTTTSADAASRRRLQELLDRLSGGGEQ